jgi:hypothetical protein
MHQAHTGEFVDRDAPSESGKVPAHGAAYWLSLAATPTFAMMALYTAFGGSPHMGCSALHDASPLSGMGAMYLLMSAFHSTPWLKLISRRRGAHAGPDSSSPQ